MKIALFILFVLITIFGLLITFDVCLRCQLLMFIYNHRITNLYKKAIKISEKISNYIPKFIDLAKSLGIPDEEINKAFEGKESFEEIKNEMLGDLNGRESSN